MQYSDYERIVAIQTAVVELQEIVKDLQEKIEAIEALHKARMEADTESKVMRRI